MSTAEIPSIPPGIPPGPPAPVEPQAPARRRILAALGLASIIGALMQTMVLPLLPRFPGWLDVSTAAAGWIATSTMLIGAISAPIVGWMGDRFGHRRIILGLLALLAVGSLISALSTTLGPMLLGRTLQGCATGIVGLAIAILRDTADVKRLPMSVGILTGSIGIGTSLGVPLSGIIVAAFPWQAVFWISALSSVVAIVAVLACVPSRAPASRRRFDLVGAAGLSVVLLLFLLPLSGTGPLSPARLPGQASLIAAFLLGLAWFAYEARRTDPLVNPHQMRHPAVGGSHAISLLLGFAFFVSFFATITVVQSAPSGGAGLGGTVFLTGMVQLPASLLSIAAPPISGYLTSRTSAKTAVATGILIAMAAFGLRGLNLGHALPVAASAMLASGGMTFAMAALPNVLLSGTPRDQTGSATGVNMLFRQVGAAVASVTAVVILARIGGPIEQLGPLPFYWLFGLGATGCVLALVVLALIPRQPSLRTGYETP